MVYPYPPLPPPSLSAPIRVDGSELDVALSNSQLLTQTEILNRRSRRLKQLARIYRDHYWALMEELKLKHRQYYWECGKSPTQDAVATVGDVNNGNLGGCRGSSRPNVGTRCEIYGCRAKAMALTKFCHMHILSDSNQKLYKACSFSVKCSAAGPILCGKPILRSAVPSYCAPHFQKAEKLMGRALKSYGLNVSSTNKLSPKLHVVIAAYICRIQIKRKLLKSRRIALHEASGHAKVKL